MSTSTKPALPEGLSVQAVAKATGLDRSTIYRAAEAAQLGSPAHFAYRHDKIIYTLAGLCQLAEGLERLREDSAAKLLREVISHARQEVAARAGVTAPPPAEVEHWLTRFERRQEEMAA